MANDGTVKIGVKFSSEDIKKSFAELKKEAERSAASLKEIDAALKLDPGNVDALVKKQNLLSAAVENSKKQYDLLADEMRKAEASGLADKDVTAYKKLANALSDAAKDAEKYSAELKDVSEQLDKGRKKAIDFSSALSKVGSIAKVGLKGTVAAVGSVATAAAGAVTGLLALESATEEYRIAQGKLNTAFEAAGYGPETASQAYTEFYKILGDTDTAAEASQLLSKLAQSEADVATWTNVAAGVYGTFGDALPIEGLIESANETAKVGKVTGTLADALNWAGINEDQFNEQLAAAGSEAERNQLIMSTLSLTYDEASDAFYRNNETIIEARKNAAEWDETLAKLGDTIANIKNQIVSEFLPYLTSVVQAFDNLISGAEGAEENLASSISGLIAKLVEKLPEFLTFGLSVAQAIVQGALQGIVENLPSFLDAVIQIIPEIVRAIAETAPLLLDAGVVLLTYLANGLRTGIPALAEALPGIIQSIIGFISENASALLDVGVLLLQSIIQGIGYAIPHIAEALPEVITSIVTFITDHLPELIEAGTKIILTLAQGLVYAIPYILEALPEVVNAILDGLSQAFEMLDELLPDIIQAAARIIGTLAQGIIESIPVLLEALPQIGSAILDALADLPGMMLDLGVNIIQGLVDGILSMIGSVVDAVGSVVSSLFSAAESEAEVHSPSKRAARLGANIDQGLANGLTDNVGSVEAAVAKLDVLSSLEKSMPDITRRVSIINDGMVPGSVAANLPSEAASTSGNPATTSGGTVNHKFTFEFMPREAATFLRAYNEAETVRYGTSLVDQGEK